MSPALVGKLKPQLKGHMVSGATIHFNPGEPLPEELIPTIVLGRKKENEAITLPKKSRSNMQVSGMLALIGLQT